MPTVAIPSVMSSKRVRPLAMLRNKNAYHLVVLKSTVLPGSCDRDIIPTLEARSGKRCGSDFGFCYNPEFIALGSVIHNIFNPDLVLIGESNETAGDRLVQIFARLLSTKRPTARMNLVNAELAKLAVNSYVTMKITFANLLPASVNSSGEAMLMW